MGTFTGHQWGPVEVRHGGRQGLESLGGRREAGDRVRSYHPCQPGTDRGGRTGERTGWLPIGRGSLSGGHFDQGDAQRPQIPRGAGFDAPAALRGKVTEGAHDISRSRQIATIGHVRQAKIHQFVETALHQHQV